MPLFIGIDLGTSSVKCAAFDEHGVLYAQADRSYDFVAPQPGRLEIDPRRWWDYTREALADVVRRIDASLVQGIGLSGVMMMAVMLDADGVPVRPTISWLDQRVLPQLAWLREQHLDEALFQSSGTSVSPSQTPLPLLWVRQNEPENFKRIAHVILSKDYVRYRLTGQIGTDLTDASGTLLLNNRTGEWNEALIQALGLSPSWFPLPVPSAHITGTLLPEVAQELGLPSACPVVAGGGDGVTTNLGLGITRPGELGITVGTAGVLVSNSPQFVLDEKKRCLLFLHPVPGQWYLCTATNTAGEAVRWFVHSLFADLPEAERYRAFMQQAAASPVGARGVLFLPFLAGSRSPYYNPTARGTLIGLELEHTRADMARAVMEGVAYEIRDCFAVHQEILRAQGQPIEQVRISGGIIRNPLWLQILADVLQQPLYVPRATELGALGAAVNAAVGTGVYSDHAHAIAHMNSIESVISPNPATSAQYEHGFELYRSTYRTLVPLFPKLARPAA